jgi:hypothetical protein
LDLPFSNLGGNLQAPCPSRTGDLGAYCTGGGYLDMDYIPFLPQQSTGIRMALMVSFPLPEAIGRKYRYRYVLIKCITDTVNG